MSLSWVFPLILLIMLLMYLRWDGFEIHKALEFDLEVPDFCILEGVVAVIDLRHPERFHED